MENNNNNKNKNNKNNNICNKVMLSIIIKCLLKSFKLVIIN